MAQVKKAMVLAAGLGTRMRAHAADRPKPLVPVSGKALIDHALSALAAYGVEDVVVNVHHMADDMEEHLKAGSWPFTLHLSDERDRLLETGGGVKKALPLLGKAPFFVINSDALWTSEPSSPLDDMARMWRDDMGALLMLVPRDRASGYNGAGDFFMEADGRLSRRGKADRAPWIFGGVHILDPALLDNAPEGPFSLNLAFDRAIGDNRLYGCPLSGRWFHVGDAAGVAAAEKNLS